LKPTIAQAIVGFLFNSLGRKIRMRKKKLKLRFEPGNRFEVTPAPAAPFRGTQETELEQLKARLVGELLATTEAELYAPYRRAANEAAAIAWTTYFPLLVFPELLEEKAREARDRHERQQAVLARSRRLMDAAA
jgi:hypothetical protein